MADFELSGLLSLDASEYTGAAENAAGSTEELGDSADTASESLIDIEPAGAAASGALAGVGTAAQDALDSTKTMREELGRTSVNIDMTRDATTDMATELSNATRPVDDVSGAMSNLAQAGVESEDQMRELVPAFDSIADATGTSATEATDLAGVMQALDGDFSAAEENADAFVAAANETQLSLSDVTSTIERLDFEKLQEMGVQSEDAAALVAKFGEETGFSGKQLRSEFRQAVEDSDGSMQSLIDQLGLSEKEFRKFQEETASGTSLTEEYAEANNEATTAMDKARAGLQDVQLQAAGIIEPISAAAPAMQAVGTAGMFLSTVNISALVPSFSALSVAMGPITVAVLAIAAAVGALALAWKTDFMGIQGKVKKAFGVIQDAGEALVGFIKGVPDTVKNMADKFVDVLTTWHPAGIIFSKRDEIMDALPSISDFVERASGLVGGFIDGIRAGIDDVADAVGDMADAAAKRLPGSDAEEGPLSTLTDQSRAFGETFAQETRGQADNVGDAAGEMAGAASENATAEGGAGGSNPTVELIFSGSGDLERAIWSAIEDDVEAKLKREGRRARNRGVRST